MSAGTTNLAPGRIARVRQRTYLVEEVVRPPRAADSTLVRLSCVDDDNQGQPLEVLWEKELDPQILTSEAWEAIASKGFDETQVFASYLNTLKWNCVTATDPKLFQSPFRAGIRLDAYQLEPLRKALRLPRVNLFIADDVGLGKTIEAGLIARELLLRKKAREIVVSCPPSMLLQWRDELEQRFGLIFEILDKDYICRVRRERGFGVNPWSTHSRFLISHRLLIDEAYSGPLLDWLGDFRDGSLLILDEAHHAAPASGQKYAIDSQITRAVRDMAPRFEHRLFLSATPHNGHSNSFSALLEILDPQRFCRGVQATKKMLDDVMVRRLKDDIREVQGGFPKRQVEQVTIDGLPPDAPELRLSRLLDEYRGLREQRLATQSKRQQAAAGLLLTNLQQRLLSSIEAFARTLRVHRKTVLRQWEESQASSATKPLELPSAPTLFGSVLAGPIGSDDDRATLAEEDLAAEEDSQVAAISAATTGPFDGDATALFAREQQLLDEMTQVADASRALPDARVSRLIAWIRANMCPDLTQPGTRPSVPAKWNDTRVLIFTEYDDTKRYLFEQLITAIQHTDQPGQRIAVFHGPTPDDQREEIKQAFNADPAIHPLRILIATDAAREGLNLQAHCSNLFHFDVPWNPSRMEQRNGRIDRKLQPRDVVTCHYFYYRQRAEDRILAALVRKTERIRKELGSLAQVIDSRLTDQLKRGIRHGDIDTMERDIETADLDPARRSVVDEELEANRERHTELRQQIDRLRTALEESQTQIGLRREHFQAAISCALHLVGGEPLATLPPDGRPKDCQQTECLAFPALDQRKSDWASTLDSLRTPRPRGQKLWEWRNSSPIRPIVFHDPGVVTDQVVHLHLEHRVVQRLLGRFIAQGFVFHDLSRACLTQARDAIPRVIVLGRLALYGPNAARLHEEIIPITARWIAPEIRKGPLTPYARDSESKTLQLLEESLLRSGGRTLTSAVQQQLLAAAARDIQELLPHLQARGEEYAADAAKKLRDRAKAESNAMREILSTQKKHIETTVAKYERTDPSQQKFEFAELADELRQLEDNHRYWVKRLVSIDAELGREPQRIEQLYEIQATRIEPVGLAYLWPETS